MIFGFRDKATAKIWNLIQVRNIPVEIQKVGLRKLTMLNGAKDVNDLRIPPSNHLEKMKKDREGQYSIRINDQWRICFVWENGNAFEVQIVDYH